MEYLKKKSGMDAIEKEIVFSKSVKAGKRIYYLDVKKNRKNELYLAITESKKVVTGEGDASLVSFEKHKIFLYKEDFEKFVCGLQEAIEFIDENQPEDIDYGRSQIGEVGEEAGIIFAESLKSKALNAEIKIDIDFE